MGSQGGTVQGAGRSVSLLAGTTKQIRVINTHTDTERETQTQTQTETETELRAALWVFF